jgi:hypothetical protein
MLCALPHDVSSLCMSYRRLLITATALAMTLTVSWSSRAHETAERGWCANPNDGVEVVSTFKFDGHGLRNLMDKCGVVDNPKDNWKSVGTAIGIYCNSMAPNGYTARPIITGPKSFLSDDHHQTYRIDDGLEGGCAVCIP